MNEHHSFSSLPTLAHWYVFFRLQGPGRRLISALHWLTRPASSLSGPDRRRANLLTWLLLSLTLLSLTTLLLVLMVDPSGSSRRSTYVGLILGLILLLTLAYALNRTGHYFLAAGLT